MGTIKSKMILISLLVLISLFTGCTFTFVTSSVGELIIENEVLAVDQYGNLLNYYDEDFPIRAIVAYKDGEEYYRMDGVYKNEECNIPAGEYCTYQWDSGTYDILLYSYYNDYWYLSFKEDVYVPAGDDETITLYNSESMRLVPGMVSSMYDNLPEIVKASF